MHPICRRKSVILCSYHITLVINWWFRLAAKEEGPESWSPRTFSGISTLAFLLTGNAGSWQHTDSCLTIRTHVHCLPIWHNAPIRHDMYTKPECMGLCQNDMSACSRGPTVASLSSFTGSSQCLWNAAWAKSLPGARSGLASNQSFCLMRATSATSNKAGAASSSSSSSSVLRCAGILPPTH